MTPDPRQGQEQRPMFSGHCIWCDLWYAQREPAIFYVTTDNNNDLSHYYSHPHCHRLVMAYLDTGEPVPEVEHGKPPAREILRRRPDLLDALDTEDAAWFKSRLLPPPPLDAAQIEALRVEWMGLRDTLTKAREAMQAEMRRWNESRSTYGRRTRAYNADRMQALEPYVNANNAAIFDLIKFENMYTKGFRFPWEQPTTQDPQP